MTQLRHEITTHNRYLAQPTRSAGFTLLELLLSLAIMAVIITVIFGALRIGVRSWEKGEQDVEINQRIRAVFSLIKSQIASLNFTYTQKTDGSDFSFMGEEKSLEFFSKISLLSENHYGQVYVKYLINIDPDGMESLTFYEKSTMMLPNNFRDLSSETFQQLIKGKLISFNYFMKNETEEENSGEWFSVWGNDGGFPDAIKISYQTTDHDVPMEIVIPCIINAALKGK